LLSKENMCKLQIKLITIEGTHLNCHIKPMPDDDDDDGLMHA